MDTAPQAPQAITCIESDGLMGSTTGCVASLTNYHRAAPDVTDPMPKLPTYHTGGEVLGPKGQEVPIMALAGERFPAITRTVWELDDGRRLTNELDADGCRQVVGPPDADD